MWNAILMGVMLVAAPAQQEKDTTIAVDPRARLRMEDVRGDVVIHTWSRPEMRVHASDVEDGRLHVSAGGPTVTVGIEPASGRWNRRNSADFELTIPATMSISLSGPNGDVHIEGTQGEVNVETTSGDIQLQGGSGIVSIHTVSGDVSVTGARARTEVHATSGDLQLSQITGDVIAQTINGDVSLHRIDATSVEASTVSGDLQYEGTVKDGGRYSLTSHSGDITFDMPPSTGAIIGVSTFSGEFNTDIPVQLTEQRRGQRFSFTVGSGGARIELQSFSGDIHLARGR
ncbi:MAG TPA: DUF4097 family beta strand repeat-containing protein [Longimicrobiales bacterium]